MACFQLLFAICLYKDFQKGIVICDAGMLLWMQDPTLFHSYHDSHTGIELAYILTIILAWTTD